MLPRYKEWLQYTFYRPITSHGWYFDLDVEPFESDNCELVNLIICTMENCGRDLSSFSDDQVYNGLEYILNNSCSETVFSMMSDEVPVALKLRAVASLKTLYRECFTPRCAPVLSHIAEPGVNRLNMVCYMLWDTSPLSYWERTEEKEIFYSAIVDVMASALTSSNPACVESGLHGLGHAEMYCPDRVTTVIDAYLQRDVFVAPELRIYANQARAGRVQ